MSVPDEKYLHLLEGVEFRPIFIIGPHRSGTTVLHHILQETNCFNVVTTYHILSYGEILTNSIEGREAEAKAALVQRFAGLGLANRIVDDSPVSPDHSEEYGFVIDDTAWQARINANNVHRLIELCRKIQYTAHNDKPILLKNPWDFSLFMYLHEAFPQARFIFIHRHPLAVINSQLKFLRHLIAKPNPYMAMLSPGYARRFERPLRQRLAQTILETSWLNIAVRNRTRAFVKAADYYLDNISQLPPAIYTETSYEALCADPLAGIHQVMTFLNLTPEHPVSPGSIRTRPLNLETDIQRYRQPILHRTRRYRQRFQYAESPT